MSTTIKNNFGSLTVRPPLATNHARIGLLGGSFNPAHEGHRLISDMALKQLELNRVWWLVSPGNPIKSHNKLSSLNERIEHAKKVSHHNQIEVTGFEATLPTNYTAETIKFLNRRYKNVNFVWLMGADNLINFHRWQKWQDLFMSVPIAVFDRPGFHLKAISSPAAHKFRQFQLDQTRAASLPTAKPPQWCYLTHKLSHISSTALRRANRVF